MTYFADLTPYKYGGEKPRPDVLNIGWLSIAEPFESATPDRRLLNALAELISKPQNLYRGFHTCEFCPAPPSKMTRHGIALPDWPPETRGNGEIRVLASSGLTYVAPVLVLHYVAVHHYRPPQQFIDAAIGSVSR